MDVGGRVLVPRLRGCGWAVPLSLSLLVLLLVVVVVLLFP